MEQVAHVVNVDDDDDVDVIVVDDDDDDDDDTDAVAVVVIDDDDDEDSIPSPPQLPPQQPSESSSESECESDSDNKAETETEPAQPPPNPNPNLELLQQLARAINQRVTSANESRASLAASVQSLVDQLFSSQHQNRCIDDHLLAEGYDDLVCPCSAPKRLHLACIDKGKVSMPYVESAR